MLRHLFKYVTTPDKKNPCKYNKKKYWLINEYLVWLLLIRHPCGCSRSSCEHVKILKPCTLRSQAWSGSLETLPTLALWLLNLLSGKRGELDCTYRPRKPLVALPSASEDLHLLNTVNTSAPLSVLPESQACMGATLLCFAEAFESHKVPSWRFWLSHQVFLPLEEVENMYWIWLWKDSLINWLLNLINLASVHLILFLRSVAENLY